MSGVIEFVWPALTLEHDTATGWTNTRYPDGHTSGSAGAHGALIRPLSLPSPSNRTIVHI